MARKCIFMQKYFSFLVFFVTFFSHECDSKNFLAFQNALSLCYWLITNIEHLWPNLITRPPFLSCNLCCRTAACCLPAASPAISHLNSFILLQCWLKNDTHIAIYRLMQSISKSILTENAKTLRPGIVQNLLTGDTGGLSCGPVRQPHARRRSWRYSPAPPRHDRHQIVRMYRSV